ncbi:TRAM domain-containing protein [Candidatus Nanohalovita haloferacivicina]|uniref:TRAM domain-containing protein n=1 Tax=Candidatus Nanohalovita haloferacivicina TaxID=2978046 RepID=UPI00325FA8F6|nr:Putative RNA-binding protein, TRAM domain family [Candidatus Nanohalobia archaeon BNXNv]
MTDNTGDFDDQFNDENLDEMEEAVEEVEEELEEAEEALEEEMEIEEEIEEEDDSEDFDDEDNDDDEDLDKPVSEGEIVELEVEDLGSKGDGIARVEGFVVFVPGGEVGKKYDVEVTSVGRKFAFAEIEEEVE